MAASIYWLSITLGDFYIFNEIRYSGQAFSKNSFWKCNLQSDI
jgi:hypothetical protein